MAKVTLKDLERVRGIALTTALAAAKDEAVREFQKLKSDPLFMAGVTLFWSGGTRTVTNRTRYASGDPEKIQTFLRFLTQVCGVGEESIRLTLVLPPDVDPASAERFWAFASRSPMSRFYSSSTMKTARTSRTGQGTCTVLVGGRYLREKLGEWLKILPKALLER